MDSILGSPLPLAPLSALDETALLLLESLGDLKRRGMTSLAGPVAAAWLAEQVGHAERLLPGLAAQVSPNSRSPSGQSWLMWVAVLAPPPTQKGDDHWDRAWKTALSRGCDPFDGWGPDGTLEDTPVGWARKNGRESWCAAALKHAHAPPVSVFQKAGWLQDASTLGQCELLQGLLDHGASVFEVNNAGQTLLASPANAATVRLLLRAGLTLSTVDRQGWRAADCWALLPERQQADLVSGLPVALRSRTTHRMNRRALLWAAWNGNAGEVKRLLGAGVRSPRALVWACTGLMSLPPEDVASAGRGFLETVNLLLASKQTATRRGKHVLSWALDAVLPRLKTIYSNECSVQQIQYQLWGWSDVSHRLGGSAARCLQRWETAVRDAPGSLRNWAFLMAERINVHNEGYRTSFGIEGSYVLATLNALGPYAGKEAQGVWYRVGSCMNDIRGKVPASAVRLLTGSGTELATRALLAVPRDSRYGPWFDWTEAVTAWFRDHPHWVFDPSVLAALKEHQEESGSRGDWVRGLLRVQWERVLPDTARSPSRPRL